MLEHRGCRIKHQNTDPENQSEDVICNQDTCSKLASWDWFVDVPDSLQNQEYCEIRFKNTRKGVYHNVNKLKLVKGDIVAVEASPGHDIGVVSMIGDLVMEKIRIENVDYKNTEFKKIYRKAKQADIDKWREAIALEHETMIRSRRIAEELKLDMKIGDVEYQGDKTKAIFYYIADDRVDFRELIKILAEKFKIRVEMRQIGARQEAGRIGGIGACGRELCCSSFINNFVSVTTNAARFQEVSLNPQKLAGQCSKLKCCINYEIDSYMDARKDFPEINEPLYLLDGMAYHQKTDIFKGLMWFSSAPEAAVNLTAVPIERVKEIIAINKRGQKPGKLIENNNGEAQPKDKSVYQDVLSQDSIDRFQEKRPMLKKKPNKPTPSLKKKSPKDE